MCQRPDCPTKDNPRSRRLKHWEYHGTNPLFNKETDMMPDGFHAKPYRLWKAKPSLRRLKHLMSSGEISELMTETEREYASLPSPKPDYMEFAALKTRRNLFESLFIISQCASFPRERNQAAGILLEYTKSKPKQELVLFEKDSSGFDNRELLAKVLQLNGLDPDELLPKLFPEKMQ